MLIIGQRQEIGTAMHRLMIRHLMVGLARGMVVGMTAAAGGLMRMFMGRFGKRMAERSPGNDECRHEDHFQSRPKERLLPYQQRPVGSCLPVSNLNNFHNPVKSRLGQPF
ncbi:hypothetical protein [Roseibium aggregatum]|uniref:hypothetical protein n=1 Tax=Roseibium aggregatum TaxID=187304 RepID=UPI003A96BE45